MICLGVLEEQWCHSFAVVSGTNLYWVINCGKHGITGFGDAFQKLIVSTVSSYICRAGVSYFFKDIHQLEDIAGQITRDCTPEQQAHRGLLRLMAHDQVHKTQYVKALRTFLACDRNVSQAAQALLLHRSSLTRQLERIRTIMELPETETFRQDLYLRLSLYPMEREA